MQKFVLENITIKHYFQEATLKQQLTDLKHQLDLERKLCTELKRLMVATISEDLQEKVVALTMDKISLAHRVEEFSAKILSEDEQIEQLQIDRDLWRCKFLAQSIRTDELSFRMKELMGMLRDAQRIVRDICGNNSNVSDEVRRFATLDLYAFFGRSPCEQRNRRLCPNYSNVTISCCRNCSGREIYLL
ncbi:hypothetical protein DICVIV_00637 [Dictyocaulus viviparus]|uniref:Uncharacterized protein n=1 Tax=Dictyocaulus viviparus TaxID=29172 RepID=A0A0D8YAT7_DICVI|nr:hypothetical protein DICVIV_00637 [Dictyocaulus viviparus]